MSKKNKQLTIEETVVDQDTGEVLTIQDIAKAFALAMQPDTTLLPKIKTSMNAKKFPLRGETNLKPSITIPDQSMTVKELIDRYTKGLPLGNIQKVPLWMGEEDPFDGLDPRQLDLAERVQMLRDSQELIKQSQELLQRKEKDERIKKQQADIEAEIERRMAEKEKERISQA